MIPSARHGQYRDQILKRARESRLPAIYAVSAEVEHGGLMSYGVNYPHEFRRTTVYVDKILKGAKPADLQLNSRQNSSW